MKNLSLHSYSKCSRFLFEVCHKYFNGIFDSNAFSLFLLIFVNKRYLFFSFFTSLLTHLLIFYYLHTYLLPSLFNYLITYLFSYLPACCNLIQQNIQGNVKIYSKTWQDCKSLISSLRTFWMLWPCSIAREEDGHSVIFGIKFDIYLIFPNFLIRK